MAINQQSILDDFIATCIREKEGGKVTLKNLYETYRFFSTGCCEYSKVAVLAKIQLKKEMEIRWGPTDPTTKIPSWNGYELFEPGE